MTAITIPSAALSQHIAVLGKTGSGKTSTAKLLVEQVVPDGARVCVLDPIKSDWWGLTLAANGVDPGLPFQILGGPKGHVSLHSAAGKSIAEVVASGSLPLSIIDMADFAPGGQAQFFTDFAPALLRKMRGVLYLVIEEAHLFAPKERSGIGKENMAIHWAKTLAQAGRSKGLRLIPLAQRTQALHNALLGSCDTLIAHRQTAPADQEPIIKWLGANTDKKTAEKIASSLSSLKTGEGWLCSGEAQIFERRQFPRITTYDNTATPTDGDYREVTVPAVDVDALKALIGLAAAEAEANDPKRLKEEVARLRGELAKRPTVPPPTPVISTPQTQSGAKPMSAAVEQKLDALTDAITRLVSARSHPSASLAPAVGAPAASMNGDEEALYQRFKARLIAELPLGGSITVTPPEKLRLDFQREEADRIVAASRELSPLAKRVQKLLETTAEVVGQPTIAKRLGRSNTGNASATLGKAIDDLAALGFVEVKARVGARSTLREKISGDLAFYQASAGDVEQVYQAVVYEMATAGNEE